jgi:cell division transport system permease protein
MAAVMGMPTVDTLKFIDKDEAWVRFETLYGAAMLDAVDENPFPASLEITLDQKTAAETGIDSVQRAFEQIPGVEAVTLSAEWLSTLKKFSAIFMGSMWVIVPVLLLALHFMIANTVKLTIYARKDLIKNMYYVGATDRYIKTPFVMEGILQGMIGGVIAIAGLYLLKMSLYHFSLYWGSWYYSLAIFSVGVFFGWIGSMSAVRRFLV